MKKYNTIIWGLGAMGSAALYACAKRGLAVLGIDQFSPPHIFGSSHGDTRIIRQAIGEGEQYTPLALQSYALWKEIENKTGEDLLTITGGLVISKPHVDFFKNTIACAKKYHIAHEILDAQHLRKQFPQFNVTKDDVGFYEFNAGFLRPEKCVETQLALAKEYGAYIHVKEKIEHFSKMSNGNIKIKTNHGEYETKHLIITAGPWLPEILPAPFEKLLTITRQVLFWFDVKGSTADFSYKKFPVFIWKPNATRIGGFYGFPAINGEQAIKIARGQYGETTDVNTVNRKVSEQEITDMYEQCIAPYLPDVSRQCIRAVTCLYTNTPDEHFIIDKHPSHSNVFVVSPCSGHGFKYSAAIGEGLAEFICEGKSTVDLSDFRIARFSHSLRPLNSNPNYFFNSVNKR